MEFKFCSNDLTPLQPLKCGPWRKACEDGHCSLVTPERVLSKYNEDLIFSN